ncbi:hypothetical protein AAFJ72_06875 [Brevibacillus gelatini]|uniref:phosphoribosyltransferase-like protein n=1 Tax=Brevibacillus gelatini TaxID=1655277 RepID=UPI003D81C250
MSPKCSLNLTLFHCNGMWNESLHKIFYSPILGPKNIKFTFWRFHEFHLDRWAKGKFECCWPTKIENNSLIDDFISFLEEERRKKNWKPFNFFRDPDKPTNETLFSSLEARYLVEKAFLEKGIEIFNLSENPNHSMMPMGYNFNCTLGFGSLFITYRNIPNNCPLVLWWGDLDKEYPLNQWLPLFPRRTNW